MTINFKDKEIEIKQTLRSLVLYENITGATFHPSTLNDIVTLFYCVVITSAKDYSIEYDDFLDYLDENMEVFAEFSEWLQNLSKNQNQLKKE